jgi:hypothetical protein
MPHRIREAMNAADAAPIGGQGSGCALGREGQAQCLVRTEGGSPLRR